MSRQTASVANKGSYYLVNLNGASGGRCPKADLLDHLVKGAKGKDISPEIVNEVFDAQVRSGEWLLDGEYVKHRDWTPPGKPTGAGSNGATPGSDDDDTAASSGGASRRPGRDLALDTIEAHYSIGRTDDERVYLLGNEGPNLALLSGAAKAAVAARVRRDTGRALGRQPLDEAWLAVEGDALQVPKVTVPVRVAGDWSRVVLDLGAPDGRGVVVTAAGWQIVPRSPVTMRRSRATVALPDPVRGADLTPLWELVNIEESSRDLLRGWLVLALVRALPHPILQLLGEMGSAKTTATRIIAMTIDPAAVTTMTPPRDLDSWSGTAAARWVLPIDNTSKVDNWWSDELCRTVTGGGTLRRALYTDDDMVARKLHNVVILNGITMSGGGLRADLAERLMPLHLRRPQRYRTEAEIDAAFSAAHPQILGALLDDLAAVMQAMPSAATPYDLRMADFAAGLAALDTARGTASVSAYRGLVADAAEEALSGDGVAMCVLRFMDVADRERWQGPAAELHRLLVDQRTSLLTAHELSQDTYWPGDGAQLSRALSRSGPLLRLHGVDYDRSKGARGAREITLTKRHPGGAV